MADKKLAKEYVRNKVDKGNFDLEQFGKAYFSESSMEHAYLAGFKAGRPKWHKVADGDLPPEDSEVLALLADKEIYMAHFYRRNVWDKIGPVIAWCEIPKYTEE